MKITPLLVTLVLGLAPGLMAVAQDQPANNAAQPPAVEATPTPLPEQLTIPGGMTLTPQLRARLLSQVQDLMVMSQNTAVWTPQGLVVLQGNHLLVYAPDLSLKRSINLPVPPTASTLAGAAAMPATSMANLIPPRIIPTDRGLYIIRWQQIIRLDKDFMVISQALLPSGPPLTAEALGAVCPLCLRMAMAIGMNLALGPEMPTAGNAGMIAPNNAPSANTGETPGSAGNVQPAPSPAPDQGDVEAPCPPDTSDQGNAVAPAAPEQPSAPVAPAPAQPEQPAPPAPPSAD